VGGALLDLVRDRVAALFRLGNRGRQLLVVGLDGAGLGLKLRQFAARRFGGGLGVLAFGIGGVALRLGGGGGLLELRLLVARLLQRLARSVEACLQIGKGLLGGPRFVRQGGDFRREALVLRLGIDQRLAQVRQRALGLAALAGQPIHRLGERVALRRRLGDRVPDLGERARRFALVGELLLEIGLGGLEARDRIVEPRRQRLPLLIEVSRRGERAERDENEQYGGDPAGH